MHLVGFLAISDFTPFSVLVSRNGNGCKANCPWRFFRGQHVAGRAARAQRDMDMAWQWNMKIAVAHTTEGGTTQETRKRGKQERARDGGTWTTSRAKGGMENNRKSKGMGKRGLKVHRKGRKRKEEGGDGGGGGGVYPGFPAPSTEASSTSDKSFSPDAIMRQGHQLQGSRSTMGGASSLTRLSAHTPATAGDRSMNAKRAGRSFSSGASTTAGTCDRAAVEVMSSTPRPSISLYLSFSL